MKLETTFKRAVIVMSLVALGTAFVLPTTAGAGEPGPIQFPLHDPGPIQCPDATYVVSDPGPIQSPSFVLVGPGPSQCPAGIDVLADPGPIGNPQGQAVALPLTAASCAAGTALFNTELSLLGAASPGPGPAGSGPPTGASPCPDGDTALAALHAALASVVAPPGSFARIDPGPISRPGGFVLIDPGPTQAPALYGAYRIDATGTPRGVFVFHDPGPVSFRLLRLVPSGTPGVSVLHDPGPISTPGAP